MPLKLYCPDTKCCAVIEYTLEKPRFCPQCGRPLDMSIAAVKEKIVVKKNDAPLIDKVEDEQEVWIDADQIQFEGMIESFGDNKGITFDQLSQQRKTGFTREVPKKINKKKEIEAFRIEASRSARVEVTDGGPE